MTGRIAALALALLISLPAAAVAQSVLPPKKEHYASSPFGLAAPTIPHVLIVMSKDKSMYQQGYVPLVDFDGDGRVDTGFNPAVVYTGYYDPYACYGYNGNASKYDTSTVVNDGGGTYHRGSVGDDNGVFVRVAKAAEQTSVTRPAAIKGDVPLNKSATGICRNVNYSSTGSPSGTFSGNWLNYLTTSRIDAIRKILYGGTRSVDDVGKTVLEGSFVPADSTTWGMEVMADNLWSNTTPMSPYYDIRDYTPFDKPNNGTAHFFARTRDRSNSVNPVFRMLPNASKASFNVGGPDSVGATIAVTDFSNGGVPNNTGIANARYWDWALGNRPCPNDESLLATSGNAIARTIRTYVIRVQVCEKNNYDPLTEPCQDYNGNLKPVGLLQQYGAGVNGMRFGLLTGSYNNYGRSTGGVLRNHINTIDDAVDPTTGQIKKTGLIANMDRLMMSGRWRPMISAKWPEAAYRDIHAWVNPVGEMLYEGVRYFASLSMPKSSALGPTANYAQSDRDTSNDDGGANSLKPSPINSLTSLLTKASWTTNRPSRTGMDCAKPVILLISDINAEYDGDWIVEDVKQNRLSDITPASGISLPDQFSLSTYLSSITKVEGYAGKPFFFAKQNTDDCSSKTLSSLKDVKGLCPHGPTFEGTYTAAAVAYYAHTHDFALADDNGVKTQEEPIDIYAVTMSSAYPELVFEIKDGSGKVVKKATIMPGGNNWDKHRIYPFLNYYIVDWQTDRYGNPFSVTIQVNYTDLYDWESDWEMDVIVQYKIDLLTTSSTSSSKRTSSPLKVRTFASGYNPSPSPSRSSASNWSSLVSGSLAANFRAGQYYGFENRSRDSVDDYITISPSEVVGLAIETWVVREGSSYAMAMGYTISGVKSTYNGTYFDARINSPSGSTQSTRLTPPECEKPWVSGSSTTCGANSKNLPLYQYRTFEFGSVDEAEFLPNPMWLAAKYGGFKDLNNNGQPDDGEWDTMVPGTPDNYFQATNISALAEQLGAAFEAISKSVATGTATSASVNSILGGGISIQTLYYTDYTDSANTSISWVGSVYGLFIDKWSNLREDSNNNKKLDVVTGEVGNTTGDFVIEFNPNPSGGRPLISRHRDIKGDNNIGDREGSYIELEDVKTVWNTAQWLAGYSPSGSGGNIGMRTGWEPYTKVPYRSSYKTKAGTGRRIYSYFPDDLDSASNTGPQNPVYLDTDYHFSSESPYLEKITPYLLQESGIGKPVVFGDINGNYFTITPYGQRPTGNINVVIQSSSSMSEPVTLTTSASGNNLTVTITRRSTDGYAAAVVAAINAKALSTGGIYGGNPVLKAALPEGQTGQWLPGNTSVNVNSTAKESAELVIEYIRGQDITGFRNRTVQSPWKSGDTITWRLGDVINSKPIIVGAPASNYDLLYRDPSYYSFQVGPKVMVGTTMIGDNTNSARRQVAYVGGNDGMLHAINVGFYGSLSDGQSGYTTDSENYFINLKNPPEHDLGSEIWAYIPTSVLPHLQWLADPEYNHSYYVDLKPQLVDVRNQVKTLSVGAGGYRWELGEWRTILINGLRLGGRSINMSEDGNTRSYSEYFALDINDPESPPTLLWRFSHPRLGLTTGQPTVVSSGGKWYVVLASGPTYDQAVNNASTGVPITAGVDAYEGISNQSARLFILDAVTGELIQEIDSGIPNSFFNDSFTPQVPNQLVFNKGTNDSRWDNHVVYYGLTVSPDSGGLEKGGVYRLKMVDLDLSGNPTALPAGSWELTTLINAERPVTGAINSAYDNTGNLWVIFGTGRLWSWRDTTPCAEIESLNNSTLLQACLTNHEQYFFGVKEPLGSKGFMTFDPVPNGSNLIDLSATKVYNNGLITNAGAYTSYRGLQNGLFSSALDGYRRKMQTWSMTGTTGQGNLHEVIVTQPKITGLYNGESLAAFTSHEPSTDECSREGQSYLYLVDTFTGLPAPYMDAFGFYTDPNSDIKDSNGDVIASQVTGFIHAGKGQSTEAVIIGPSVKTTGQLGEIYSIPLPENLMPRSSIISWREVLDMGFSMSEDDMKKGLPGS